MTNRKISTERVEEVLLQKNFSVGQELQQDIQDHHHHHHHRWTSSGEYTNTHKIKKEIQVDCKHVEARTGQ